MFLNSSELALIGLTCNLVGVFFLANSITLRRSRRVLEEFFGKGRGSLAAVRDYALNRMQVVLGFLFLNAGFLLLIAAFWTKEVSGLTTTSFCLGIIGFAFVLYLVGAVYSRRTFRRLLREFFQSHSWSFTENMSLTKEIGLLLGIEHSEDMTVEDYLHRVRRALGVKAKSAEGAPAAGGTERGRRLRDISPLADR